MAVENVRYISIGGKGYNVPYLNGGEQGDTQGGRIITPNGNVNSVFSVTLFISGDKYHDQMHFQNQVLNMACNPYQGLDSILTIQLPPNSKKPICVKFPKSRVHEELEYSRQYSKSSGSARSKFMNQYIIGNNSGVLYRKFSRLEEYFLDTSKGWVYRKHKNGTILNDPTIVKNSPEWDTNTKLQLNCGSASTEVSKEERRALAEFKYYGSFYHREDYVENITKRDNYIKSKLGKTNITITDSKYTKLSPNDDIYWSIILSKIISNYDVSNGLSFQGIVRNNTVENLTVDITNLKFITNDGQLFDYCEVNNVILSFDYNSFFIEKTKELVTPYAIKLINKIKNNEIVYNLDNWKTLDIGKYKTSYPIVVIPKDSIYFNELFDSTSGLPFSNIVNYNSNSECFNNFSYDEYSDYLTRLRTRNTTVQSSSYYVLTNKDQPDLLSKFNNSIEGYGNRDINLIQQSPLDWYLDKEKTILMNNNFENFTELLKPYDITTRESFDITYKTNIINEVDTDTYKEVTIKPMFQLRNFPLELDIYKIRSQGTKIEVPEGSTELPTTNFKEIFRGYEKVKFCPFLYILDDYEVKDIEIPNPIGQPQIVTKTIVTNYREPKEYKFKINKDLANLQGTLSGLDNVFLITYIENGKTKYDYISEDYVSFKNNTSDKQEVLVRHIPFVNFYNIKSYAKGFNYRATEIEIILIPSPPYVIPLVFPREVKGLAASPTAGSWYNIHDKYINLYLKDKRLYPQYFDTFENPDFKDIDKSKKYKIDNTKRIPPIFGNINHPFFIERPFKLRGESIGFHDYNSYYGSNPSLSTTKYYYSNKFSFTPFFDSTFRQCTQHSKMGYQYLDYLFKSYYLVDNIWNYVNLHTPHRIHFSYMQKTLRLRRIRMTDQESELETKSYSCFMNGNYLEFRSKSKKYKYYLDLDYYLPGWKSTYGIDSSSSFNDTNVSSNLEDYYKKYVTYFFTNDGMTEFYNRYIAKNQFNSSKNPFINPQGMLDYALKHPNKYNKEELITYYEGFTIPNYPNNSYPKTLPNNIKKVILDYISSIDDNRLISIYNDIFGTNYRLSTTSYNGKEIVEYNKEYNELSDIEYTEEADEITGNIITKQTQTLWDLTRYNYTFYNTNDPDSVPTKPNEPPYVRPTYTGNSYYYKDLLWLYTYSQYKGLEDSSITDITANSIKLDGSIDKSNYINKDKIITDLSEYVYKFLPTNLYVCTNNEYYTSYNTNDTNLFKIIPQSKFREFVYNGYIIINDIGIQTIGTLKLRDIVKIDCNITNLNRVPNCSYPFLPLFEDFYKRLSYINKYTLYRLYAGFDMYGTTIVACKWNSGGRWRMFFSLITIWNTAVITYGTWQVAISNMTIANMSIAIGTTLGLISQLVFFLATYFMTGSIQSKFMKLAKGIGIAGALIGISGALSTGLESLSITNLASLSNVDLAFKIMDISNVALGVINKVLETVFEINLKKEAEELAKKEEENKKISQEIMDTNDELTMQSMNSISPLLLDKYVERNMDLDYLVNMDRYVESTIENIYNFDIMLESKLITD
ncbi:hypothetical protein L3M67_000794 [Campylobacter coli]|nr:hypothetical protein [Campylobacter coli]